MDELLLSLKEKRDLLEERLIYALRIDTRVEAAWLTGSIGRDEADPWSDLDLHVAVKDDFFDQFRLEPQELFDYGGPITLIQGGFPSNSMPDGYFWLVLYSGLVEVDWNIGPAKKAQRPLASKILFERFPVPLAPEPLPLNDGQRQIKATNSFCFFWAMAPIALKYAGRGHTFLAVNQITLLRGAYIDLWRCVWRPDLLWDEGFAQNRMLEATLNEELPRFGPVIDPLSVIDYLLIVCNHVDQLQPHLRKMGVTILPEIFNEVIILAEIARIAASQGGSSPQYGSRR